MQLYEPQGLSASAQASAAFSPPTPPIPRMADLVQGRQAILVGQIRADPTLKKLADCEKGEGVWLGHRATGQHCSRPRAGYRRRQQCRAQRGPRAQAEGSRAEALGLCLPPECTPPAPACSAKQEPALPTTAPCAPTLRLLHVGSAMGRRSIPLWLRFWLPPPTIPSLGPLLPRVSPTS